MKIIRGYIFRNSVLPKPVGLFPLDKTFGAKDVMNQENVVLKHVQLTNGPDGECFHMQWRVTIGGTVN